MREELEKDLRKYKWMIFGSVLGLDLSLTLAVRLFKQNDHLAWLFVVILAADIYELYRDIKRYRETKAELQK